jgi:hypothetical protein
MLGGSGGELTSRILKIQKRVIRLMAGVNPVTFADKYSRN